jgi:hypothetical protein
MSALAAQVETEGLNIKLQILRVGMPLGPNPPVSLAAPTDLDVDKFGELKVWEGKVIKYVEDKRNELAPVIVSASINIDAGMFLDETPGIRFAMWRIFNKQTLEQAIALLDAGKAEEVNRGVVRALYAKIFNDPTMIIPDSESRKRKPGPGEFSKANRWLRGYKKM